MYIQIRRNTIDAQNYEIYKYTLMYIQIQRNTIDAQNYEIYKYTLMYIQIQRNTIDVQNTRNTSFIYSITMQTQEE